MGGSDYDNYVTHVRWKTEKRNGSKGFDTYEEIPTRLFDHYIADLPYKIPRNGEINGLLAKQLYRMTHPTLFELRPSLLEDYNWYVADITTYDITVDR